jgi:hypothetical protein
MTLSSSPEGLNLNTDSHAAFDFQYGGNKPYYFNMI